MSMIKINRELCKGCIDCIRVCPTEALRVRQGKAILLEDRCIDCGECITVCPEHA
ncbi:4Fe-4S binding protein, partial [bacterium]|nr:4Fe-4S binding protein [bacterium]